MSAILSADDLNDFVKPGVACIKPIETLPLPAAPENPYEVTTEDQAAAAAPPPPATITLSDCLACSGCVTSAETVLISMQSHAEVLDALDAAPAAPAASLRVGSSGAPMPPGAKIFVASVSPQVRASLAATYGVSERAAGCMVEQLLSGPGGLASGGAHGSAFAWVVDTNAVRDICLCKEAEQAAAAAAGTGAKRPLLASACPGWICYVEKERPQALGHLSALKSPQALAGTLVKSALAARLGVAPARVWHVAVMPCFDKKLEASRRELTDDRWARAGAWPAGDAGPVRDVDCVITARELLALADARGLSFPHMSRRPLAPHERVPFPDPDVHRFLFARGRGANGRGGAPGAGTSGGFLQHVLADQARLHPAAVVRSRQGRRVRGVHEVVHEVCVPEPGGGERAVFRAKRVYGFENIVNLTNKMRAPALRRPAKAAAEAPLDYVEVMACPGGCTNGGGQIRLDELHQVQAKARPTKDKKEWLRFVDEAYFSMSDGEEAEEDGAEGVEVGDEVNGISPSRIDRFVAHWEELTGVPQATLLYTTFKEVESDVGKQATKTERAAALAGKIGGGW